jgi:hypothetical protein
MTWHIGRRADVFVRIRHKRINDEYNLVMGVRCLLPFILRIYYYHTAMTKKAQSTRNCSYDVVGWR